MGLFYVNLTRDRNESSFMSQKRASKELAMLTVEKKEKAC
jgi:hypothetical protein